MLIRAARAEDLPLMQAIARRTIDRRYRRFLGDERVDWYINSGECDRELARHLDRCDVLLVDDAVVAFSVYINDLIHLMMVDADRHREGTTGHISRTGMDAGLSPAELKNLCRRIASELKAWGLVEHRSWDEIE
jgi:hypothetical protein